MSDQQKTENALTYDDITAALKWAHECHEEVARRGEVQPCDLTAVGLRIDPSEGAPYPVCVKHTRHPMVPLDRIGVRR